jgi:hypothetical protein
MPDLISALARLRAFRSTWEGDATIDEGSQLTAADLDTILAAAEGPDDDGSSGPLNGGDYDLGELA